MRTYAIVKDGKVVGVVEHMHASMVLGRRGGQIPLPAGAAALTAQLDALAQQVLAARCPRARLAALAQLQLAIAAAVPAGTFWDPKQPSPAEQQGPSDADLVDAEHLRQRLFGNKGEEAEEEMEEEETRGMPAMGGRWHHMRRVWDGLEGSEEGGEKPQGMMPMMGAFWHHMMGGEGEEGGERHHHHHMRDGEHHHHHRMHDGEHHMRGEQRHHMMGEGEVMGPHHHPHMHRPPRGHMLPGVHTPAEMMASAHGAPWMELRAAEEAEPGEAWMWDVRDVRLVFLLLRVFFLRPGGLLRRLSRVRLRPLVLVGLWAACTLLICWLGCRRAAVV